MNKAISLLSYALLVVSLAVLSGMGGKPDSLPEGLVTVSSTSIRAQGEEISTNKPFVVSFSAPMVKSDDLSKDVDSDDMPIVFSPKVAGRGMWVNESVFSFQPDPGYKSGEKYFVMLKDNLKALDGALVRHVFSFKMRETKVANIRSGRFEQGQPSHFFISFNMPVKESALKSHLRITDDGGNKLAYSVGDSYSDESGYELIIPPAETKRVTFTIEPDTKNDAKPLGLWEKYEISATLPQKNEAIAATIDKPTGERENSNVAITAAYSREDYQTGKLRVEFYLNSEVDQTEATKYIKVEPDLPFFFNGWGDTITVEGNLEPGQSISLKLLPGLTDTDGNILNEERSFSKHVGDRRARASLSSDGNYLVPENGLVGISYTNVRKINVSVREVYQNSLQLVSVFDHETRFTKNVFSKEVKVTGNKNEIVAKNLNLQEFTGKKTGVFLLKLTAYGDNDTSSYGEDESDDESMSYLNSESRIVVLSDIGLTVREFPQAMTFFANSLTTGKALADTTLRVFSYSNQLLFEGKTDAQGLLSFIKKDYPAVDWKENPPFTVTAEKNEDATFLEMNSNLQVNYETEGERDYLGEGYEAFVYTPRGVFKPGETVQLKTFVRDTLQNTPTPFPVEFIVVSSRNIEVARKSVMLSEQGGADFSFDLSPTAPSGMYIAKVAIPGQKDNVLGVGTLSVEDFVPPRLEVGIVPAKKELLKGETLPVTINAEYLFGAPGAYLTYELGYRATAEAFSPKGWDEFVFGDTEATFKSQVKLREQKGVLDADGGASVEFVPPADWTPAAQLKVMLFGTVQEEGGRWVTKTDTFTYYPTPYFLGVKLDKESKHPGKMPVTVAAVTPDAKATSAGTAKAELYSVHSYWHTVRRDNRYQYISSERLSKLQEMTVDLSKGLADLQLALPGYGNYILRVSSEDGTVHAARKFSVWSGEGAYSDDGSGRMDKVELSLDKKAYSAGENAVVTVKAPFAGTLFLGVERDNQFSTSVIDMQGPSTQVEIPVTEAMTPNVYITAWVYRGVSSAEKEWTAHRAYGVASLSLASPDRSLKVQVEAPQKSLPSAPVDIAFTVTDSEGKPVEGEFSVALVDEGILSLTAFSTPNPMSFFMAQRRSVSSVYDAFNSLMRPDQKAAPLLKAGGDGTDAYMGSLSAQQIFLVEFLPTVKTDSEGKGRATFSIPEYSGKGRLMVVGAAGNKFATSSSQITFARDMVVEANAPRAVAPGDSFDLMVKAFTLVPGVGKGASITITASGPVEIKGSSTLRYSVDDTSISAIPVQTKKDAGIAAFDIALDVPGREDLSFTKHVEVAVRAPFPRTSATASAFMQSERNQLLTLPGTWLDDKTKATLVVAKTPVVSVLPALSYLQEYPYGCLEQTTSRVWPWLVQDELQSAMSGKPLTAKEKNNTDELLKEIVFRLANMQTSDNGYSMWPGGSVSSPWLSVNTIFFMVEAKSRIAIPDALMKKNMNYLRYLLAASDNAFYSKQDSLTTKAYAAFVLAKAGDAPVSWLQYLSKQEHEMLPSGRIFLAAAKSLVEGNAKALRAIEKMDLGTKYNYTYSLESPLRNLALKLYVWSIIEPQANETGQLSVLLAEQLLQKKYYTTQEAGMASLAFGTFLKKSHYENSDVLIKVASGGTNLLTTKQLPQTLEIDLKKMGSSGKGNTLPELSISLEGKGSAYGVYSVRGVPLDAPKPASNIITIERNWFDSEGNAIDFDDPVWLTKGDKITVQLLVTSSVGVNDVVISDLLPGGLEIENPRLKTTGEAGAADENVRDYDTTKSTYDLFMDARDDRILLFYGYLEGTREYRYSARAVSTGTFVVPPVAAEAMYDPTTSAIGQTWSVQISTPEAKAK